MTADTTPFTLAETARRRRRRSLRPSASRREPATEPVLSPTQQTGLRTEDIACDHLLACGLAVLERNLRCPLGELDIVARDGPTLVFVEVRHRESAGWGGALGSITPAKQRRLIRTAHWFLPALARRHFGGRTPRCRFDVFALEAGELLWLQQAFTT